MSDSGRFSGDFFGDVPGWSLTALQGERLVLGAFDLPPVRPDRNCTRRAPIDAMPADGAFIYVFEYYDLTALSPGDFPSRTHALVLGPELAFEYMGESRMLRWEDHGRAFQAHVYLGPQASDHLREDALSIRNSIEGSVSSRTR